MSTTTDVVGNLRSPPTNIKQSQNSLRPHTSHIHTYKVRSYKILSKNLKNEVDKNFHITGSDRHLKILQNRNDPM